MVFTRMQLNTGNSNTNVEGEHQEDENIEEVDEQENENHVRRRYHFYDEEAESHDELENPDKEENHTDFQVYPLQIDWSEIENEKSDAYAIWDIYGYFGAALFTSLSKLPKFKLSASKFYKNIIEYYFILREGRNNKEAAANLNINKHMINLEDFIKLLPNLSSVRKIIEDNLLLQKELIIIKIVLEIYEDYYTNYDYPLYKNLLDEYIPTALKFYSCLTDEDIIFIYDKLSLANQTNEFLKKCLNLQIYKKRSNYSKHLIKLKKYHENLIRGLNSENFIR